jgi:anti-sigma-K factor RskA
VKLEEYISSGILEAYALGELSDNERAQVEKHLEQYPALREELSKIEQTQEELLMASAVAPRASLKNKIIDHVHGEPARKVVQMSFWKFAAAASITIAVVSTFMAIDYRTRWKASESDLTNLIAERQQMAQNYNQVNDRLNRMENDLEVMDNPKFQRIIMTAAKPENPDAMASVYWNASTSEVYLRIQNLKELARDQQYQLWAIIDGKPVDAGVFDGNVAGLIKMKKISEGAATFAVTVEPRGGKSSPTLETMQVAGHVGKS